MATLADVIKKRRTGGQSRTGSLFGSLKDKLKESIDPRQLIDQTGILTALFPSLKAYKAKGVSSDVGKQLNKKSTELISSSAQSSQLSDADLSGIAINTEIAAKNTMILPNLSRDVNVMRQNISKLVKVTGQKPETKADSYFKKSKDRETDYEKQFEKKSPKSPSKAPKGDESDKDDGSKSKGFLGIIGKLITSLIGAVVGAIKFVIGSLVGIIKGLLTTLITGISSLIKTIFTTVIKLVFGLITKIGSKILKVAGFIKNAIAPFLTRLMTGGLGRSLLTGLLMGTFGQALILAVLVAMGLKNLAEDFIKGKKAQERLRELRGLAKKGLLTPDLEMEMQTYEDAGVTATSGEARGRALKETHNPEFVNKMLDTSSVTDDDIKKEFGVSREVLEAYRQALSNRDIMAKNHIPIPSLYDVARSFGEKIERGSPTPTSVPPPTTTSPSREETDIRSALEEDYKQSHLVSEQSSSSGIVDRSPVPQPEPNTPSSSAVTNLTQTFNEAKKVTQANSSVSVLPNSSSVTDTATPSPKKTVLPDVINVDYPTFGQSQIITV